MNPVTKLFYLLALTSFVFFLPSVSSAAVIFSATPSQTVTSGQTFTAHVLLNTEGENINVVEGSLEVSGAGTKVSEISLAGSVLALWPSGPSIASSATSSVISFTGGVPGGFNKEDGLLFSMDFTATEPGKIVIQPQNIVAYKNDGKGTSLKVTAKPLTVTILAKTAETLPANFGKSSGSETTAVVLLVITLFAIIFLGKYLYKRHKMKKL